MSLIKIENRTINLIDELKITSPDGTTFKLKNKYYSATRVNSAIWYFKIAVNPDFSYNFSVSDRKNAEIKYLFTDKNLNSSDVIAVEVNTNETEIVSNSATLINSAKKRFLYITFRTNTNGVEAYIEAPKLVDSSSTDNNININEFIEVNNEFFGYFGVYDELLDDGTLIKRWEKETGISISGGAGTIRKSGIGNCILVNETTKLPYEGTVSGTSISTSAPNGTYTIIYQLASPIISTLYLPEKLKLYSGDNNIIVEGGTGVLATDANIEYHL